MAKRLTDTNKYKKPFIRGLKGAYKLLWDYLYHDCDHAGIWIVDFQIAQLYIGQDMPVNKVEALAAFNTDEERIIEFDGGKKWFIPSFIEFQYGELKPENRVHNSAISTLSKFGLYEKNKGLIRGFQATIDKDKDKDTVLQLNKEEPEIQQPDPHLIFNLEKVKQNFDNDYKLHEMAQRENFFSSEEMDQAVTEFWNTKQLDPETIIKPYSDFQKHFLNWCRQNKVRIKKKEKLQPNGEVKTEFKRIVRA